MAPLAVPAYLPAIARPVVPFARRHCAHVATRYHGSLEDLWDEAIGALLRATVSHDPATGRFGPYAQVAIHRALARAVHLGQHRRTIKRDHVPLEDAARELVAPSAETEVLAREAARRAWILREHAALAAARGDDDTTTRLLDAASAADRVAGRPRRHAPPSSKST